MNGMPRVGDIYRNTDTDYAVIVSESILGYTLLRRISTREDAYNILAELHNGESVSSILSKYRADSPRMTQSVLTRVVASAGRISTPDGDYQPA